MEHSPMPNRLPADLLTLTAATATRLIRDGKLRPEALMDAYLDHIAARNPAVEAFAHSIPLMPARGRHCPDRPPPRHPHRHQGRPRHRRHARQYGSPIWASADRKADSAP